MEAWGTSGGRGSLASSLPQPVTPQGVDPKLLSPPGGQPQTAPRLLEGERSRRDAQQLFDATERVLHSE